MPDSGNASANGALQAIVDFLPSGVSLFDRDFNMVLCNRIFR